MKEVIFENRNMPYYFHTPQILTPNPHFHKDLELIYVVKGKSIVHADQKKQILKTGDLCIVFPNQIHYYENCDHGKYIVIVVAYKHLFGLETILRDSVPENHVINLKENGIDDSLPQKCISCSGTYAKTGELGYINVLVSQVLPFIQLSPRIQTKNPTLNKIFDFCTENFREEISLSSVSEAVHISKYHISRLLNQKIRLSFSDYINLLRIQESCKLLVETNKNTIDISESVGFGSIRSFNRAFSKIMKMTPSRYRKLQRDKPTDFM